MVPSAFVGLSKLPLTANGKIDYSALPPPPAVDDAEYLAPRTDAERVLAEIWADVLRLDRVSTTSNFFTLGGDSILSIQIVARANRAGLRLTPTQVFEHQTVSELAAVAVPTSGIEDQTPVSGSAPMTPAQRWFFEEDFAQPHHFNQSVLFRIHRRVDPDALRIAVRTLLEHHDALRSRFTKADGEWMCLVAEAEAGEVLEIVDVDGSDARAHIERDAQRLQCSLDLERGPLTSVCLFRAVDGDRLLVVIHHLVVDGVSWRTLLEDLQRAYEQAERGERCDLGPKTTSFKRWAEGLVSYANGDDVEGEVGYWTAQAERAARLGADRGFGGGRDVHAWTRTVGGLLDPEETRELLTHVPSAYGMQITEVLLAALGLAVREHERRYAVLVDLEGHGREDVIAGVDVSRTVGWFTTLFPVLVVVGHGDDVGQVLREVKEQVRDVPRRGIGYGLLRYMREPRSQRLPARAAAPIGFNYLGQIDQPVRQHGFFATAAESAGAAMGPDNRRQHELVVTASVAGGRLRMSLAYSEREHEAEEMSRLADSFLRTLRSIVVHCRQADAGSYTPSDFPLAALDQDRLEAVLATVRFEDE
jgi:non-ribosomal peptide synthase protein (TIGR01720 family)